MRRLVLGTAGHIDHGKTALVRALTGVDTDRLPDEKRRGITIDLGFASLALPDGTILSIVDVPGHEAFIRNMLAGATGIDLALLVVAADEGVMPQTREHLAILELLGVHRAVVALTRIDLVEPDWLQLVQEEVAEVIASSSLEGAPIVAVSSVTGSGLDALRSALAAAAADVPPRSADDLFRMPIDRVFTVRGTGTVVTGTVWTGAVARDTHVRVLPAGVDARVRGLQQHGRECDEVTVGARAAIALGGVDRTALTRGDTLLTGDAWLPSSVLTVDLHVIRDAAASVRPRQRVRVHLGTAEVLARVALLDGPLEPGGNALAQLRLESPVVARVGDHFVIRAWSPVRTIGGGLVLEAAAPKRKRLPPEARLALGSLRNRVGAPADCPPPGRLRPAPDDAVIVKAAVELAGAAGLRVALLPLTTGLTPDAVSAAVTSSADVTRAGDRLVLTDTLRTTEAAVLDAVASFHGSQPMQDGIEREALRRALDEPPLLDAAVAALITDGRIRPSGNALSLPGHAPAPDAVTRAVIGALHAVYSSAGLEPPDLEDLPSEFATRPDLALLIRFLERDGRLFRMTGSRLVCARSLSEGESVVRSQMAVGEQFGVADFRDVLNLSRRHLIPLLEHFDRTGVTRREGEKRVLLPGRQGA